MKRLELLIPPPLVMLFIGLIMWLTSIIFPTLTATWLQSGVAAAATALLGLVISLAGILTFQHSRTTIDPRHPTETSTLVSSGIYRYSRNPMYLGALFVLVGWAVYLGNLLSIICTLAFIAYIRRFQIMPEERLLQEKIRGRVPVL